MLKLHPKNSSIELVNCDFNSYLEDFSTKGLEAIVSSSALQWSKNLDRIFNISKQLNINFYFSIFTSNTFSDIHNFLGVKSPILTKDEIERSYYRYFTAPYTLKKYRLTFKNRGELLRHLQKSGVNRVKLLDFKSAKNFLQNYESLYLDYEVMFILHTSRTL